MGKQIYIGGKGDNTSGIVKNYAKAQQGQAGRTVAYFEHTDKKGVIAFAKKHAGNGEPLNIIGHIYGTNTAISAAKALSKESITVNNLVGVDGVKKPFHYGKLGKAASSVDNVIGVNASGDKSISISDTVATVGDIVGGLLRLG